MPERVLEVMAQFPPGRVGAVMPVAPFGHPVDVAAWDRFDEQTRLPVVIDAAAGFDAPPPGRIPTVVSLHPTKILGAGEGGFIVAPDKALVVEIERRSNFGFIGGREARVAATSAKLNEYNAIVALASLDVWPETRAKFINIAQTYYLRRIPGVMPMAGFGSNLTKGAFLKGLSPTGAPSSRQNRGAGPHGQNARRRGHWANQRRPWPHAPTGTGSTTVLNQ
jgi:hypothetical protein